MCSWQALIETGGKQRMRFGAFDIWGVSSAVKFLSISVTLGFCAHYICGPVALSVGFVDTNSPTYPLPVVV